MAEIRVIDGSKFASFDGLVLEISGMSGSASAQRIAVNSIEKIGVSPAGDELMFMVKTANGGFGLAVSVAQKPEWEALVTAVETAIAEFKASQ